MMMGMSVDMGASADGLDVDGGMDVDGDRKECVRASSACFLSIGRVSQLRPRSIPRLRSQPCCSHPQPRPAKGAMAHLSTHPLREGGAPRGRGCHLRGELLHHVQETRAPRVPLMITHGGNFPPIPMLYEKQSFSRTAGSVPARRRSRWSTSARFLKCCFIPPWRCP